MEKKRSVVRIQNNDNLCMARALVVAKAKADDNPQYKSIADQSMQTRLAQELHTNADVPLGPYIHTYIHTYILNLYMEATISIKILTIYKTKKIKHN